MEYQKIINLLDNTPNQSAKFRTKYWVEINDDSSGTYNTNNQIKFNTSTLRSILYHHSDAYVLVRGSVTVSTLAAGGENGNIQVIFKNYA